MEDKTNQNNRSQKVQDQERSEDSRELPVGNTRPFGTSSPSQDDLVAKSGKVMTFGDKEIDMEKLRQETYVGQKVAGRFNITKFIDRGGMGEVYLGENEALGQKVAIKFLNKRLTSDEQIVARFGNEAKSYARVNHPHAVTLLDYGQHDDGALYIITEFVEGKPLSKTVKSLGPMSPVQVISIGQQCCDVLSAAHKEGVIHRDLKPDNIMLIPGPRQRFAVKLLDFGIAKISDEEEFRTETGAVFGTPEFMSPEQAKGEEAKPASDLYALGVILYYMCSGRLPFSGKNKFSILNQHLNDPPVRPSQKSPHLEIPPTLEAVILKCLNKQASERYESAEDLYDALSEVYDSLESTSDSSTSLDIDTPGPAGLSASSEPLAASSEPLTDGVHTTDLDVSGMHLASPQTPKEPVEVAFSDPDLGDRAFTGKMAEEQEQSVSMEFGQEHDSYEEDDSWTTSFEVDSSKTKRLSVAVLLIAVFALGVWVIATFSSPKTTEEPKEVAEVIKPSGPEVEGSAEMDNILVTGQVLGLLASAEIAIERGEVSRAKKHLETSAMWVDDEDLPERAKVKRQEIRANLETLRKTLPKMKAMRRDKECAPLRQTIPSISSISPALGERWLRIANRCDEQQRKKKPVKKAVPKKAPKKPVKKVTKPVKKPPEKTKDPSSDALPPKKL